MELLFKVLAAPDDVLVALLLAEPPPDLLHRGGGLDIVQVGIEPVAAGAFRRLGGDNLHDGAALQRRVQRNQLAVHFPTDAAVPHIGMDAVGEVYRCGAGRQLFDLALRREDVDVVLEYVGLDRLHELSGSSDHLLLPINQLPEPGHLLLEANVALAALLVAPVGGDAELRCPVHLLGAYLYLQSLAVGSDHRGVERLVHALLGRGDVVVEPARDRVPERVDQAQSVIALRKLVHDDPNGKQVVDVLEVHSPILHLAVNAVNVFRSAADLRPDARLLELVSEDVNGFDDLFFPCPAPSGQHPGDSAVLCGFHVAEGQVLELPLQLPDAQTSGQRGVYLKSLLGYLATLVGRKRGKRPHIVQAVGQLDEHHADVLRHGQQHLAQVLGQRDSVFIFRLADEALLLLDNGPLDSAQLGNTVNQPGDLCPELRVDLPQLDVCVL